LNGNGWIVASETCALDHLGAEFVREVQPGEAVAIDEHGLHATQAVEKKRDALCVFEYIYFARPDSVIRGKLLHPMRMNMGRELARQAPVDADLVIGVPDSATAAAIGYSHEAGIPYAEGLVKNRYVGRTFIQPDQRMRDQGVYLTIEGLMSAVEQPKDSFCTACFTGEYPMPVQLQMDKLVFERAGRGGKRVPVGVAWSWEEDRR